MVPILFFITMYKVTVELSRRFIVMSSCRLRSHVPLTLPILHPQLAHILTTFRPSAGEHGLVTFSGLNDEDDAMSLAASKVEDWSMPWWSPESWWKLLSPTCVHQLQLDGHKLPITAVNSTLDSAEYLSEGHGDGPGFQVENCDDRCIQHGLVHLALKAFLPKVHNAFIWTTRRW